MLYSWRELSYNVVLNTHFVTMYSMCNSPFDSRRVFDGLDDKNLYQWKALISGYTRNEMWDEAVCVFRQLISMTGLTPDNFSFPCVIKACGGLLFVELGRALHGFALKMGLPSDTYVGNALIAMYGKCGFIDESIKVFEIMPQRNLVSWNALICGFSKNVLVEESFDALLDILPHAFTSPDR